MVQISWDERNQNTAKSTNVLQDSNYMIENLNSVKYPKRYVYIYNVDIVNNTHGVNKL